MQEQHLTLVQYPAKDELLVLRGRPSKIMLGRREGCTDPDHLLSLVQVVDQVRDRVS